MIANTQTLTIVDFGYQEIIQTLSTPTAPKKGHLLLKLKKLKMTNPNDVVNATDEFVFVQNPAGSIELQTSDGTVKFERIKVTRGLTKREYFAVHTTEPLPSSFCQKYIRKKEEKEGGKRMTAGNYYEILTPEERIEVRALWRVKCADALINALNQQ